VSELEKLSHIHNINYSERYQMNLAPKTANLVYTRCGIWEKFKKPGLAKEALGILGNLTPV
jgi:hypothetical protein